MSDKDADNTNIFSQDFLRKKAYLVNEHSKILLFLYEQEFCSDKDARILTKCIKENFSARIDGLFMCYSQIMFDSVLAKKARFSSEYAKILLFLYENGFECAKNSEKICKEINPSYHSSINDLRYIEGTDHIFCSYKINNFNLAVILASSCNHFIQVYSILEELKERIFESGSENLLNSPSFSGDVIPTPLKFDADGTISSRVSEIYFSNYPMGTQHFSATILLIFDDKRPLLLVSDIKYRFRLNKERSGNTIDRTDFMPALEFLCEECYLRKDQLAFSLPENYSPVLRREVLWKDRDENGNRESFIKISNISEMRLAFKDFKNGNR